MLLSTMLGLQPIGEQLVVDPALPQSIGRLELLNLRGRWGLIGVALAIGAGTMRWFTTRYRITPEPFAELTLQNPLASAPGPVQVARGQPYVVPVRGA